METTVVEQQPVQSLHDDFIDTLQATGMLDYAMQINMIQDGQLPDVKDDMRAWPADSSTAADVPPGLSEDDIKAGELLAMEAQIACDEAITAAEQVKKRQKESMENFVDDDLSGLATPSKRQKSNRRGSGVRSSEGGRSGSKGLRHFSMKVCEKVEGKGRTTYNEVADELVTDLPNGNDPASPGGMQYDEKNIRRRVYDALNVLMAMGIITKEKKEIFWRGLPQGPKLSLDRLKGERQKLIQKLDQQRRYIAELTIQQAQYRALMHRNKDQTLEQLMLRNATGSTDVTALPLPFVLIQVDRSATIEIQIADDNRQAEFDFDASPFKITGDEQVLQEMSLVDTKEPMIYRATNAASDAMSPRPTHHSMAKLVNGPGAASNRAHPQLPPQIRNPRPNMAATPPFNLAHLPHAAQLAALNMARGDPNLLGSLAAAARGADWIRSPPGAFQGSPNFRLPNSPLNMIRPGVPNNPAQPTLAQQLAMSLNPNGMLGSSLPGNQPNSPRGLLLAAGQQPGANLQQWGGLGPHSNQGNHARMLHGSPLPSSNPGPSGSLTLGAFPLRPPAQSSQSTGGFPGTTGLNGGTHEIRSSQPLPSSLPPLQPFGQPPRFSQDQMLPPLMNPPGTPSNMGAALPNQPQSNSASNPSSFNSGSIGNSMLNAAWLNNFQKSGFPPSTPLGHQSSAGSLPHNQTPVPQSQQAPNHQSQPNTQQPLSQ